MIRILLLLVLTPVCLALNAQQISGIVNTYTPVTAIDTCLAKISVTDTSGFVQGDAILLIQMQGATISTANNSSYGTIQSLQGAGRYERAIVDSVSANAVFLQRQLQNRYEIAGNVQLVRIARYQQATVVDTLFAQAWNGSTGGIIALEVEDTLVLHAPISADGAGFRGATAYIAPGNNNCNFLIPEAAYFYALGNWRGGAKGEGLALPETGKELGRGPQSTGGGGGNDHNAGGGGGSHFSKGGNGGNNDEPTSLGCDGYYPGLGGSTIPAISQRLFAGGGGGAGHTNNTLDGWGANGGGIVVLRAGVITGTQAIVSANGASAGTVSGDGGGGGGAGGTVWLQAQSAIPTLQIQAKGGKGGNTSNNNANRCFGPGGGGSAGKISSNLSGISVPVGGSPGIVTGSTNGCNGASNNATAGDAGQVEPGGALNEGTAFIRPLLLADTYSDTVCAGETALFYVQTNAGNWSFQWQLKYLSGWQNIGPNIPNVQGTQNDTLQISPASSLQNGWQLRCLIRRPGCFEIMSSEVVLTVLEAPTAAFSSTTAANTATFDNLSTNADAQLWDFGDGAFSTELNPQHVYDDAGEYTVTLRVWNGCDTVETTQEIALTLPPATDFFAPANTVACGPVEISFENSSSANSNSFQWIFTGGTPASSNLPDPVVLYTSSGTYPATLIASNGAGSDTLTKNITVEILGIPVAGFTYTILPDGALQLSNTSSGNAGFTWDFGDNNQLLSADTVLIHNYLASGTYTVTLIASNACGASVFQQNIEVLLPGVSSNEAASASSIHVYPNPAADFLIIDCAQVGLPPERVQLWDMTGRQVLLQRGFTTLQTLLSLQDLPSGVYRIQVEAGDQLKRQLLIKND